MCRITSFLHYSLALVKFLSKIVKFKQAEKEKEKCYFGKLWNHDMIHVKTATPHLRHRQVMENEAFKISTIFTRVKRPAGGQLPIATKISCTENTCTNFQKVCLNKI